MAKTRDKIVDRVKAKVQERAQREVQEREYQETKAELEAFIEATEQRAKTAQSPIGDQSDYFPAMELLAAAREVLGEHEAEATEAYLNSPRPVVGSRGEPADMSEEAAKLQAENQRYNEMLDQARARDAEIVRRANEYREGMLAPAENGIGEDNG